MDVSPQLSVLKDAVLFFIAIYGAALSTFNWRQAVKRDRREITVSASTIMPTYGSELGPPFAKVEAINTGHRVVTVKTITFEIANGSRLAPMVADRFPGMPDTRLPATLTDGRTAYLMMPYSEIAQALLHNRQSGKIKLTPICVDTADNIYRGESWEIDPHELLRVGA